jgi:hypothetical protein
MVPIIEVTESQLEFTPEKSPRTILLCTPGPPPLSFSLLCKAEKRKAEATQQTSREPVDGRQAGILKQERAFA